MMNSVLPILMFAAATTITPGPTNIMATYSGINFGFRRTLPFIGGMAVGFFALVFFCAFGLGNLVMGHPMAHRVLQWSGGAYLLYLAYKISQIKMPDAANTKQAFRQIGFWASVIFQFSNLKAWMMGLSASAVFLTTANRLYAALLLATILALTMTLSVALWVKVGAAMSGYLQQVPARQKTVNWLLAGLTAGSILLL